MAIRTGQSAEADRYQPGGRNYRGPIFGQQQRPQPFMSIPMGGFMGQNQIGGQSAINIYRTPPPPSPSKAEFGQSPLRPPGEVSRLGESSLEDRAEKYQRDLAEFNLGQREAELEQRRTDAEQIARGKHTIDGRPVSAREMFEVTGNYYQQDYVTPPEPNSTLQSLRQFQQNPMQFIFGGGQNVGELLGYLNQANQLFRLTGQEGNFMDALLGQSPMGQGGSTPTYRPGTSFASQGFEAPTRPGGAPRFVGFSSPQQTQTGPASFSTKQNSAESLSKRLSRLGVRPEDQAQVIESLGPSGRGSFVAREFAPRKLT